jgi:hypothetical protein
MTVVNAATASVKTVSDPNAVYETLKPLWLKSRAACSGERFVKDYDAAIDVINFKNLLIPFSPSMSDNQYKFYKAEAEWPGITAQYSKMLVGGLLRKPPQLTLPEGAPANAKNWILSEFGRDDSSLISFLEDALVEEIQTSGPWIFVDHPKVDNADALSTEEREALKPYPILQPAESVINWRFSDKKFGKSVLDRVIVRGLRESYTKNEFHPTMYDVANVHELNEAGHYQIRVFERVSPITNLPVVAGKTQQVINDNSEFVYKETIEFLVNDKPLTYIPAWPVNGAIAPTEPILSALIDKEVALYNKMSRRNHLMYGAATYTPVISSNMDDEAFQTVVNSGLGSWLHLQNGDTATVLPTPSEPLEDMEKTIAASIEEMAKLGIRMLSPETAQSGVALELRNASQTAQLGTLNTRISEVMTQIITFMLNWRYDLKLNPTEVTFALSSDFNSTPLGADWLRLATEWYEGGLIPRSVWLTMLKMNDMIPPDYDDKRGQEEITADETIQPKRDLDYNPKPPVEPE